MRCCVALRLAPALPHPDRLGLPLRSFLNFSIYLNLLLLPSTVPASISASVKSHLLPLKFPNSLLLPFTLFLSFSRPPISRNTATSHHLQPSIHLFVPRLCRNPLTTNAGHAILPYLHALVASTAGFFWPFLPLFWPFYRGLESPFLQFFSIQMTCFQTAANSTMSRL